LLIFSCIAFGFTILIVVALRAVFAKYFGPAPQITLEKNRLYGWNQFDGTLVRFVNMKDLHSVLYRCYSKTAEPAPVLLVSKYNRGTVPYKFLSEEDRRDQLLQPSLAGAKSVQKSIHGTPFLHVSPSCWPNVLAHGYSKGNDKLGTSYDELWEMVEKHSEQFGEEAEDFSSESGQFRADVQEQNIPEDIDPDSLVGLVIQSLRRRSIHVYHRTANVAALVRERNAAECELAKEWPKSWSVVDVPPEWPNSWSVVDVPPEWPTPKPLMLMPSQWARCKVSVWGANEQVAFFLKGWLRKNPDFFLRNVVPADARKRLSPPKRLSLKIVDTMLRKNEYPYPAYLQSFWELDRIWHEIDLVEFAWKRDSFHGLLDAIPFTVAVGPSFLEAGSATRKLFSGRTFEMDNMEIGDVKLFTVSTGYRNGAVEHCVHLGVF